LLTILLNKGLSQNAGRGAEGQRGRGGIEFLFLIST